MAIYIKCEPTEILCFPAHVAQRAYGIGEIIKLLFVVIQHNDEIIQLLCGCDLHSLPDLSLLRFPITDNSENRVLLSGKLEAHCHSAGARNTLSQ